MAKRYAIVPESCLQRLKEPRAATAVDEETLPMHREEIVVHEETPETPAPANQVLDLLPKNQRAKARILMHYLSPSIKLDSQQRVTYEWNGAQGSNLLDLLKYFTSHNDSLVKTPRPIDAEDFARLIRSAGVPEAALGKGRCTGSSEQQRVKWITFD
jgi:hypothetical protein